MPDAGDLFEAWQRALKQLAGPIAGPAADLSRPLVEAVQRQAELLERMVKRQVDFERELAKRVLAPLEIVLDSLEQASTAMRTQAQAFDAAAAAFKQSSDLLELQAALLDRAVESMRDPAEFVRSAGQRLAGRDAERPGADDA